MKRRAFITAAGASVAAAASPLRAEQLDVRNGRKALVLVGGVNRGVYQAGAIAAFAEQRGLRDGEPLDYDIVCGTSIGALNAYFVATAQYTLLKKLWLEIVSQQNIFRLKHPYEKIPNPDSGVGTRLAAAFSLGTGVTKNVMGVLDPSPVWEMLDRIIDPALPVHLPLYAATTNLSRRTGEIFNRRATTTDGARKQAVNDSLLANFPIKATIASDGILRKVLFATACLPLAFEPVQIPDPADGEKIDQYVDGGVTANAPINMAQLCARTLNVLLVDPKQPPPDVHYENAVNVALGVFQTMQSRILLYQIVAAFAAGNASLPFDPHIMRPESELPGKLGDFNDGSALAAGWNAGYADGMRGWQPFALPMEELIAPFRCS